ncbi:MAG: hypothetical protein ACLU38_07445 [Dysosmobacter sp.]
MAGKKSPSIFSTLQKTTENASAVNGELTRQLPVASLVDNPLNRFSMAEDDEFLSTMRSVEQDGFLEDIVVTPRRREHMAHHQRTPPGDGRPEAGQGRRPL